MDMIIGLPGEDRMILKQSLEELIKLKPENITLHALAMKRAAFYRQERISVPMFDEGKAMMDLAHDYLDKNGYIPYYLYRQKEIFAHGENVGYALPGKACLYNIQMIEERQTILGFGVGSGSKFVNPQDWSLENVYNPKDLVFYLERLEQIIGRKVDKLRSIL
jgi:oxygen-independent coproporphyrinogen-3 oxidase